MKEYDYLVVGAGLFAAVFVRQAIEAGKRCLVIDKRSHIGGNIYCEKDVYKRQHYDRQIRMYWTRQH